MAVQTEGQQRHAQGHLVRHNQGLHVWSHSCTLSWLCLTSTFNKQSHCTFTTGECGVLVMFTVASVCVSVCLSVSNALTLVILHFFTTKQITHEHVHKVGEILGILGHSTGARRWWLDRWRRCLPFPPGCHGGLGSLPLGNFWIHPQIFILFVW